MQRGIVRVIILLLAGVLIVLGSIGVGVFVFRDSLFEKIKVALNNSLKGGELQVDNIRFAPFADGLGITFSIEGVSLTDSLYTQHYKPLIKIDRIDIGLNATRLLIGQLVFREISIYNGEVFIFTTKDGYSNTSVFQSGANQQQSSNNSDPFARVQSIKLSNVSVVFADSLREKYYDGILRNMTGRIARKNNVWAPYLEGSLYYGKLVFNQEKGAFLKNIETHTAVHLGWDEDSRLLKVEKPTHLRLPDQERIEVTGIIDFSKKNGPLHLVFDTPKISVKRATSLLADSIAYKINAIGIQTEVRAHVAVIGNVGIKKPKVDVEFETDTFQYDLPVGSFHDFHANGFFTNRADTTQPSGPDNSLVRAKGLKGKFEGIPVSGDIKITSFTNPIAVIDFVAEADSSHFGKLLDPSRYKVTSGGARFEFAFNGNLKNFYNPITNTLDGTLTGKAKIYNFGVLYVPQQVQLSKVNSLIDFTEKVIHIRKLEAHDKQNHMIIKGRIEHLFENLLGASVPIRAIVDMDIPDWHFNWVKVLTADSKARGKSGSSEYKFSEIVDKAIDDLEVDVVLNARNLKYYNFQAHNVKGELKVGGQESRINKLTMDAFGGKIDVKGALSRPGGKYGKSYLNAQGSITNANVSKVFHAFSNFGQKTLTAQNIKGGLSAKFHFESGLTPDVALIPESMKGYVDFRLHNGNLINFQPFMKMKRIIFKRRPFEDVKFAPLKTKFSLRGTEIGIPKMQIESNVLTLFIEGVYSFKDKTDIGIQIPFNNLKKRDEDYELQEYDADSLRSIYLRAIQEEGDVSIKFDNNKMKKKRKERREGLRPQKD